MTFRPSRLVYAQLDSTNPDAEVDHYTSVIGLSSVERSGEFSYLSTGADHHNLVLRKASDAKCTTLGFQLPTGTDLAAFETSLKNQGIKTAKKSDAKPGIGQMVTFVDPNGFQLEVFVDQTAFGKGFAETGIRPTKLGHIAFNVPDVQEAVSFYEHTLGFKVSDWMGDFFAFLHCGPDHHTLNFVKGPKTKMHHIAFEVRDFMHIRDACDRLGQDRIPLIWGPLRHGIGHNIAMYHHDPDKQIVEFYCELDRIVDGMDTFEPRPTHQEFPQRSKTWTDIPLAANMWGGLPPESFLD
ncbi:VOC family protein [Rhizobium bangladeshense]|uniref:VOC family protein n=1 Tax=Rhizobium bangladeshense TaxID=1138189 RepID=A0ABS7LLP1_9HYPH|nr:VOC family protein [Rhizobium bangladeshense]MBY3592386.1 VOC family protein [Rhizobium bangladeshense]